MPLPPAPLFCRGCSSVGPGGHLRPRRKGVARDGRPASTSVQRVVQRIAEESRQLLGNRLHVGVHVRHVRVQIGAQHERLSCACRGVHAIRAPMAALCRIGVDVVGRVACHGHEQRACRDSILRQLLEQLLLHEPQVDHGEHPARLLRRQDVAETHRHIDVYRDDLRLSEPRMPVPAAELSMEIRAHDGVGILRRARRELIVSKDRRRDHLIRNRAGVENGFPAGRVHWRFDGQSDRRQHGGDGRRASLGRVVAEQRVRVVRPCHGCVRCERRERDGLRRESWWRGGGRPLAQNQRRGAHQEKKARDDSLASHRHPPNS